MNESEEGAQVEEADSDADQDPKDLPDPDSEGPSPDSENPEAKDESGGPDVDELDTDPSYDPERPVKGIKGG
jgi:hypothetical protein